MLDSYIKFILAHETILALVLAAAVILGVVGKVENVIEKHDKSNEIQAQIVATTQGNKDALLATQVATDKATFDALQAKVTAQDAALVQANIALVTALAKQQRTDATLPPTELVARMNTLVPAAGAAMTPTGVALPENGAVAVTQQLEEIPVQKQEIADLTEGSNNQLLVITAANTSIKDLNSLVSGLNLKAVDDKNACNAEIKVVKDEARKRERKIAIFSAIFGFIIKGAL
jgi:hypothetical protein